MKTNFKSFFIISALFLPSLFFVFCGQSQSAVKTKTVYISGKELTLEVADNDVLRSKGLMFRESLPDNVGMLFIFPQKRKAYFWMKNMKFNLDIIFLTKNKTVKILKDVPYCANEPCPIYSSDYLTDSVIEVNSGFCNKNNVTIGTEVRYKK